MPSTVSDLLNCVGLKHAGVVGWGERVPTTASGVYIVCTTGDAEALSPVNPEADLCDAVLARWLEVRPELRVNGVRPSVEDLARQLQKCWLPDEVILYVGRATALSTRVRQYYSTALGARRPHAGGHFIKTLSNLKQLYVHFAASNSEGADERKMLQHFVAAVSPQTRAACASLGLILPFANLELAHGQKKQHGITGGREPRGKRHEGMKRDSSVIIAGGAANNKEPLVERRPRAGITQPVTAKDIEGSRVRIPTSDDTKSLFPAVSQDMQLALRGEVFVCGWDPKLGPDRERSGVIKFRGQRERLRALVRPYERLIVTVDEEGQIHLD